MKFVKWSLVSALILLSAGCAKQAALPGLDDDVVLQDTRSFIPRQQYNEQQIALPYQPAENPYLAQRGRVDKGSVLLFIEAKKAMKAQDFKTAKAKLLVITGNDDSLAGPWVLMAEMALAEGELERAVEYFQKAIVINPKNVNAYTGLAVAQRHMGRFKLAQNTLTEALRVWPDFPEAHLNLGVLYDVYLNQPTLAQMHFEAYLFLATKDKQQAEAWFEEVQTRTGIQTSFIDLGPQQVAEAKQGTDKASQDKKGIQPSGTETQTQAGANGDTL